MIVAQQRKVVDGQGKANFFKQFANGRLVERLFAKQNRTGKKPSFTGTGL
jgi:hypothetical protein